MTIINKEFSVVGSSFFMGSTDLLRRLQPKNVLALRRVKTNKYDKNAVAVQFGPTQLGWVPRGLAAEIAPHMDRGVEFKCRKASNRMEGVCLLQYDDSPAAGDPAA